jgi:MFS transporter, ACS family, tartrate transporter
MDGWMEAKKEETNTSPLPSTLPSLKKTHTHALSPLSPPTQHANHSYGASLFFLGYCLPQVPLVWLIVRFLPGGAPAGLAACCLAWGVAAAAMAAVSGPASFYATRVLLGVAEAGTFPLMWATLQCFYAPGEIAHAYAALLACVSVAQIFGGPLAAALLAADGLAGLAGWRWLFIAEAVPTLVRGWIFFSALARVLSFFTHFPHTQRTRKMKK